MKKTQIQQQAPAGWVALPMQQQFKGGSPKTPPPPAPPPSATSVEVKQAKRDMRRQGQQKAGISSTVLAGETGGYGDQDKKNLLGG